MGIFKTVRHGIIIFFIISATDAKFTLIKSDKTQIRTMSITEIITDAVIYVIDEGYIAFSTTYVR